MAWPRGHLFLCLLACFGGKPYRPVACGSDNRYWRTPHRPADCGSAVGAGIPVSTGGAPSEGADRPAELARMAGCHVTTDRYLPRVPCFHLAIKHVVPTDRGILAENSCASSLLRQTGLQLLEITWITKLPGTIGLIVWIVWTLTCSRLTLRII